MDGIVVVSIYTAFAAGEKMQKRAKVALVAGAGIADDRYGLNIGFYSTKGRPVIRHITIISDEEIRQLNAAFNTKFTFEDTRRNVLLRDFDVYQLLDTEFCIGEVRMRGVESCAPCNRPSTISGKPKFEKVFAGKGGIRAEVLSNGSIEFDHRLVVAA